MKNKWIVPAIIVALGLFLLGQRIESGIVKSKEAVRTVSVKGLSEREVPADRVIWPLVYKELGNDLSSIYRAVNAKNKIVIDFLKSNGIGENEISVAPPSIVDMQADRYSNFNNPYRYNVTSVITVSSNQVDKVRELIEFAKERKAIIYYDPNFRNAHAHEAVKLMPSVLENLEYADLVKGSVEDFNNLFHLTEPQKIYTDHIQFYCPNFICTRGSAGAELFCNQGTRHFEATPVTPVSTIGAGDSFNAGILFGLIRHEITLERLYTLTPDEWTPIIRYGMDFASAVCQSMDNYIDPDFASGYTSKDSTNSL